MFLKIKKWGRRRGTKYAIHIFHLDLFFRVQCVVASTAAATTAAHCVHNYRCINTIIIIVYAAKCTTHFSFYIQYIPYFYYSASAHTLSTVSSEHSTLSTVCGLWSAVSRPKKKTHRNEIVCANRPNAYRIIIYVVIKTAVRHTLYGVCMQHKTAQSARTFISTYFIYFFVVVAAFFRAFLHLWFLYICSVSVSLFSTR